MYHSAALREVALAVQLEFREAKLKEVWSALHGGRPMPVELLSIRGWECLHDSRVVGHSEGNLATGEVLGLSVLADYQGQGIGKTLLSLVADALRTSGAKRIWLTAPSDPATRAYGFYRAVGWVPTGQPTSNGDEILELPLG